MFLSVRCACDVFSWVGRWRIFIWGSGRWWGRGVWSFPCRSRDFSYRPWLCCGLETIRQRCKKGDPLPPTDSLYFTEFPASQQIHCVTAHNTIWFANTRVKVSWMGPWTGNICKTCLTFLFFTVVFAPNKQDPHYNASPHTAESGCHLFTNIACLIHGSCSCCSETEITKLRTPKTAVIPPSLPVRAALTTSHLTALISITGTGKRPLSSTLPCSNGFSWEWIIPSILTSLFSLSSALIAQPPQKNRTHTYSQTSVYLIYYSIFLINCKYLITGGGWSSRVFSLH